ncbi:hypothetical protein ABIF65_002177 [Bradyrhizobium japonicum]|uniref:Uncharacterized protein n=1 Tax=Bradyrhizobium barranii subsp. barranii TaxID=2823807 RepID=A0A939M6F8_9BRAD|nr:MULTISPECIES: hypothetical protein [Bradyrhizobium]MBR0879339.1 hypothetical protein [Bradyrhizobium liaoningense]MBR1004473.1 hypothetical protein [Bradyrhizobium liaoningense]MBR1069544.1 hypothetical protein [Bradyrhizobium liaoningense]MCP1740675.1 hypothetical protein [Bradyrhizobium japonicum]MCP1779029.1 hypothetical protein [Bradyrhizobium japonicum]
MLDAYLRKGARLPTEASDGRRVIEDVITSTVFSPLKFMTPREAGQILSWLTGAHREEEAGVHSVQLWPRFEVDGASTNQYTIEPDLVIDGVLKGQPFRWIIEVKWDAVLLRHQIEDQVRICTKDLRGWRHISLIKSAELAAFDSQTTIIQWNQTLAILQDVLRSNAAEGASLIWCRDAIKFLEKLGVGTFKGFGLLDLAPVTTEEMDLSVWRGLSVDHLIEVTTPVSFSLR